MNKLIDTFMMKLVSKFNKIYNVLPKYYNNMFYLELQRRYQDIDERWRFLSGDEVELS